MDSVVVAGNYGNCVKIFIKFYFLSHLFQSLGQLRVKYEGKLEGLGNEEVGVENAKFISESLSLYCLNRIKCK